MSFYKIIPTPVGFSSPISHKAQLPNSGLDVSHKTHRPELPDSIIPPALKGYPLTDVEKDCIISNHILLHFMKEAAKSERAIFGADRTDAFAHYA